MSVADVQFKKKIYKNKNNNKNNKNIKRKI